LFDDLDEPWPYLITSPVPGLALWRVELSAKERRAVAAELGKQVRRVHALPPTGIMIDTDLPDLNVAAATERSSLLPHLVAQVDDYLARIGSFDCVFVNGDLVANHAYIENGRLTGIVDWGDAIVTDRHCELIQIYRDMFSCDRELLRVFLEASDWPVSNDFPDKTLGHAVYRQAIGLFQHHTIDVFEPIAAKFLLQDIATHDELATELFGL
jgi:hygromycin-B 7''-O-kinase